MVSSPAAALRPGAKPAPRPKPADAPKAPLPEIVPVPGAEPTRPTEPDEASESREADRAPASGPSATEAVPPSAPAQATAPPASDAPAVSAAPAQAEAEPDDPPPGQPSEPAVKADAPAGSADAPAGSADATREAVLDKVANIDDRLEKMKYLSELLSVRYNPFLDDAEGAVFDGEKDLARLVPGLAGAAPPHSSPAGGAAPRTPPQGEHAEEEPPHADDEPEDAGRLEPEVVPVEAAGHEAPKQAMAPRTEPHSLQAMADVPAPAATQGSRAAPASHATHAVPPADARAAGARPVHHSPASQPSATPPSSPPPEPPAGPGYTAFAPAPAPPMHRPEDAEMVLHWMSRLVEDTHPAAIHRFLDYYRHVGWINAEVHQWFRALADGIAEPVPEADWRTFGLDAALLVRMHQMSLRFFQLFFHGSGKRLNTKRIDDLVDAILGGA